MSVCRFCPTHWLHAQQQGASISASNPTQYTPNATAAGNTAKQLHTHKHTRTHVFHPERVRLRSNHVKPKPHAQKHVCVSRRARTSQNVCGVRRACWRVSSRRETGWASVTADAFALCGCVASSGVRAFASGSALCFSF